MKKQLFLNLVLMTALILTACSNDDDANEVSQPEPSDETSQEEEPSDDASPEEPSDDTPQEDSSGYDRSLVEFPEDYREEVHYETVTRGNVYEEVWTSQEAIEAVQNGEDIPDGTVITLEIHEDDELNAIFVMEKRTESDWGDQNPEGTPQNGDWLYQEFNADRSVDYDGDVGRCFTCHANEEQNDYVVTYDQMMDFDLEEFSSRMNSDSDLQDAGIPTENWEVRELVNSPDNPHSMVDEESTSSNIDSSDSLLSEIGENYNWSELDSDQEQADIIERTLETMYLPMYLQDYLEVDPNNE